MFKLYYLQIYSIQTEIGNKLINSLYLLNHGVLAKINTQLMTVFFSSYIIKNKSKSTQ